MNKKLPNIFANKISKKIGNNDTFYYAMKEEPNPQPERTIKLNTNIADKINQLFNSHRYVYKIDVVITTAKGTKNKRIIGKNKTHLITIENELIPISEIIDIEMKS